MDSKLELLTDNEIASIEFPDDAEWPEMDRLIAAAQLAQDQQVMDALEAENQRLRDALKPFTVSLRYPDALGRDFCSFCLNAEKHRDDCPTMVAQKILGEESINDAN